MPKFLNAYGNYGKIKSDNQVLKINRFQEIPMA